MVRKLTIFLFIAAGLTAASAALGEDFSAPPWRGTAGSTYQQWDFSTDVLTPSPDPVANPYGDPLLRVKPIGDWIDVTGNRQGVWPLSGEIDVYVPNWLEPRPEKEIWVQLTWQATDVDPFLPNQPVVGVTSQPLFDSMEMTRTDIVDFIPGWNHSVFKINLYPNPSEEWFTIKGDIMVDQLIIDTRCIPEPTTVLFLGIGGAIALARRKGFVGENYSHFRANK
jgi:hypothetical protein